MIYVDPPAWPARGRLWSHLISDVSFTELHAFAELLGVPRRGFDRDHYDVPAERVQVAVWLGATAVSSREIVRLLRGAGLRRPKHLTTPARGAMTARSRGAMTARSRGTSTARTPGPVVPLRRDVAHRSAAYGAGRCEP